MRLREVSDNEKNLHCPVFEHKMNNDAYLEYSDSEHAYYADGSERLSVTQILDAAGLISQFCRVEEARIRGTRVHELTAIDDIKRLDLRAVPADLRGYIKAWRRFKGDTSFRPTQIETRVDCHEPGLEYAGRFDRLGIGGNAVLPTILDIKTAKTGALAESVRLQLSAYAYAFDPKRVFNRVAVCLKPDGSYNCRVYPIGQFYTDRAEWLATVWKVKENIKSGNNQ